MRDRFRRRSDGTITETDHGDISADNDAEHGAHDNGDLDCVPFLDAKPLDAHMRWLKRAPVIALDTVDAWKRCT